MTTIPIHVVGGFLGAGKTSALVSLLEGPLRAERVAVVINDFGQGAIDEASLGDGSVSIAEIRGECVCCTAPEGFVGAVGSLVEEGGIDRILVEPTGLAVPADLIDTLRRAPYADRIEVRPLIVLVDPMQLDGPDAEHLEDQARVADVLVANRLDLATDAGVEAFEAWADELWPGPIETVKTEHGRLPERVLDWPSEPRQRDRVDPHEHDHQHDSGHDGVHGHLVETLVWPPETVFHRGRLLEALGGSTVTRAKGLFRTDEGWTRLERAGGSTHEGTTGWRRDSRVDLIGRTPGSIEAVGSAIEAAVLSDEELRATAESIEIGLPDGSARRFDRAALAALPDGVDDVAPLLPGREGSAARVGALLDAIGAPEGLQAVVVALDGYTTPPVPADALRTGLLIHSVAGEPLPAKKGGPIRLMIPGDAGPGGPCANVKGVVRLALRSPT